MTALQYTAFGLLLAASFGCGTGTGSQRFGFEADIAALDGFAGGPATFQNERGWSVTLERAEVTLGPVYLNSIVPLQDPTASVLDWLVKPAHASGEGHLGSGRIVGEVLSQVTFDALSPTPVPFPARGTAVEEPVRSAEVWISPRFGSTQVPVAVELLGEAQRDANVVRFRGRLILDDDWVPNQETGTRGVQSLTEIRKVRGIPAHFTPKPGGRLELRFDVRRLLRGADFSNLESNRTDADGTKILSQAKSGAVPRDQVMTNLYQGLREAVGTHTIRWLDE